MNTNSDATKNNHNRSADEIVHVQMLATIGVACNRLSHSKRNVQREINQIKHHKGEPTTIKRNKTRKLTSQPQKSNWGISDEQISNCHADGRGNGAY